MNWRAVFAAAVLGLAVPAMTFAQNGPGGGNGGGGGGGQGGGGQGGGRGQRGNFDPAAMQQQWMDRIKENLKASDDEWKVIQPKLEKVMQAQRESRAGGMGFGGRGMGGPGGGRGGQGGPGGGNQPQDNSELGTASRELRTVLEGDAPNADEVKAKLAAYRAAREKSQEALKTARKELTEVLTPVQEARLVLDGMLE